MKKENILQELEKMELKESFELFVSNEKSKEIKLNKKAINKIKLGAVGAFGSPLVMTTLEKADIFQTEVLFGLIGTALVGAALLSVGLLSHMKKVNKIEDLEDVFLAKKSFFKSMDKEGYSNGKKLYKEFVKSALESKDGLSSELCSASKRFNKMSEKIEKEEEKTLNSLRDEIENNIEILNNVLTGSVKNKQIKKGI